MSLNVKTVDLTMPIALRYLGNELKAIEEKLNSYKSFYMAEADGILIKWSDLNLVNDLGFIRDDQPFVFWKVSFTARVFQAVDGKFLRGRIQQLATNYIIVKAMDAFTVTVTIPQDLIENDIVKSFMLDQEIFFKMRGSLKGVFRGELNEEALQLTSSDIKVDITEENVYDYAKDFEY